VQAALDDHAREPNEAIRWIRWAARRYEELTPEQKAKVDAFRARRDTPEYRERVEAIRRKYADRPSVEQMIERGDILGPEGNVPRAPRPASPEYLALIRRFPLRRILTDDELDIAIAIIDGLIARRELTPGEHDYLDVLSDLVHRYETSAHPIQEVGDDEVRDDLKDCQGGSR